MHMLAPLPYEHSSVRACVSAAKFDDNTYAAALLGNVIAPHLAETLADLRLTGQFEHPLLIPIPLHPTRYAERGFNQCERIIQALTPHLGEIPHSISTTALIRIQYTRQQSHLSRAMRQQNVRGAFHVALPHVIIDQDIILLDDVVTTGATMREAAAILREAGAREVLCVAAAHA